MFITISTNNLFGKVAHALYHISALLENDIVAVLFRIHFINNESYRFSANPQSTVCGVSFFGAANVNRVGFRYVYQLLITPCRISLGITQLKCVIRQA